MKAFPARGWFGDFWALWPALVWSLKVPKKSAQEQLGRRT
jgi:hypothetical protein